MSQAGMYDSGVEMAAAGELRWLEDPVRLMLLSPDYQPDQVNHRSRADIAGFEVKADGYSAGGKRVGGRSIDPLPDLGEYLLRAGAVTFENFTGRFRWAVLFRGDGEVDPLIGFADMETQDLRSSDLTLDYSRAGFCAFRTEITQRG